jgi:hypothetical protein
MFHSQQSRFHHSLRCCFLLALVVLTWQGAAAQTDISRLKFPVTATAEAFFDKAARVTVSFQIYFPVDGQQYLPVNERVAALLSSPPAIKAGPGMRVRVLKTVCTPEILTVQMGQETGTAMGGRITSEVEITPDSYVTPGTHIVVLEYPMIDLTFRMIRARSPVRAEAQIRVEVWASEAAKLEAMRLAEEKRRQQEALEAQARHEARMRFLRNSLPYLAVAVLIGLVVFLFRKWFWPDLEVKLAAGEHRQYPRALRPIGREKSAESGTILKTKWARHWSGRRNRIKVETFVSEGAQLDPEHPGRKYVDKLDLLVSVGASVQPGSYLAKGPNGAVKIIVTKPRFTL